MAKLVFDTDPVANLDFSDSFHLPNLEAHDSLRYKHHDTSLPEPFDDDNWEMAKILMPTDGQDTNPSAGGSHNGGGGMSLDLNTLLRALDQHTKDKQDAPYSTWQLVIIQGVLLLLLVSISIAWACCCKRKCFRASASTSPAPSVHAALRKLSSSASLKSRDFPPSYSQVDLHTLAMSVHDYLYPPPTYPEINSRMPEDLAYLDLEGSHRQLSRLSFCESSPPSLPGYCLATSLASLACATTSGNSATPAHSRRSSNSRNGSGTARVSLSREQSTISSSNSESRKSSNSQDSITSRKSSIIKDSNSRKSSQSQDSRRSSRVSFSESVECSNGSFRRLSGCQASSSGSSQEGLRKSSTCSSLSSLTNVSAENSRKSSSSSSSSTSSGLSRKLGLSQEALDKELRRKLQAIEMDEMTEDEQAHEVERSASATNLETVIEIENA